MQSSRQGGHPDLVSSLNVLLAALHLPLALESPDDLIPSLLVAVLECLLRSRLDLPAELRQARDFAFKVQAMKIFLGVLENDIIGQDVGLSDVDPRRLASGEWDECVFVGELLCWLGKTMGVLPSTSAGGVDPLPERFARRSGTVSSSAHSTVPSNLSLTRSEHAESETTVGSIVFEPVGESTFVRPPAPTPIAGRRDAPPRRPRCIHEIEEPSLIFTPVAESSVVIGPENGVEYCDCPSETTHAESRPTPVRYHGWIERADDDSEVRSFEASRRTRAAGTSRRVSSGSRSSGFITRHTSPAEYTLALMSERAKLLTELAALKTPPRKR
ncbi:uncharacterized protein C8Q71DRAFT_700868 [Rhodofomes roseus]|uniref:Uncharacterized protein n=1 Tax=Rhodofomes roseus TaxID=34475 RepID=A0ABQ8KT51_9APHY|nr:uncharacterized protein C8Q71DRAFT_700868 [Rhodofomes roseus]KAH9841729.1 hypothetical protein C8Q71DRAFT_700868 [Rhodofomes roseus]